MKSNTLKQCQLTQFECNLCRAKTHSPGKLVASEALKEQLLQPSSDWSRIGFKLTRKLSTSPCLSGCLPEVFNQTDGVSFSEVNIYHFYSILSIKGKTDCHRYGSKTNTWQSWTPTRSLEATSQMKKKRGEKKANTAIILTTWKINQPVTSATAAQYKTSHIPLKEGKPKQFGCVEDAQGQQLEAILADNGGRLKAEISEAEITLGLTVTTNSNRQIWKCLAFFL